MAFIYYHRFLHFCFVFILLKVAGIVQINGHEVPLTDPPHVAIFDQASLVEHSCTPNLTKSFTSNADLVFWAPNPIKVYEILDFENI